MLIRDFMSRDSGDGCRGVRRNAARRAYREANGATVFLNRRTGPAAEEPAPADRSRLVPLGMLGALALGGMLRPARRRVATVNTPAGRIYTPAAEEPAAPVADTVAASDPASEAAPVADLAAEKARRSAATEGDAAKAARERAAKDRKNAAARKRRADAKAAALAA
jgi:hypothetical protein